MAAISYVFTIRRAAQILGRDEDLLWDLSDQLEPEDGKLWVDDVDGAQTLAFSEFGIETLREIIADQVDRKVQETAPTLKNIRRLIMKTILSAIVALSVLTGVAASANAFDAKSFYEQQERSAR